MIDGTPNMNLIRAAGKFRGWTSLVDGCGDGQLTILAELIDPDTAAGRGLGHAGRGGIRTAEVELLPELHWRHMGVDACSVTAAGCLVEVETDQGTRSAAFPAWVAMRAVVDAVVGLEQTGQWGFFWIFNFSVCMY